jgi:hypothetical protein
LEWLAYQTLGWRRLHAMSFAADIASDKILGTLIISNDCALTAADPLLFSATDAERWLRSQRRLCTVVLPSTMEQAGLCAGQIVHRFGGFPGAHFIYCAPRKGAPSERAGNVATL